MSSQPAPQPRFVAHRVASLQLRGAAGRRRVLAFWPDPSATTAVPPLLVLFGGHESRFDGVDGTDSLARALCVLGGAVVLSVPARCGSPAASPISLDDATAIVGWAADHASELGADAAQLALAGEGAGARIVTVVASHARQSGWPPIAQQLLIEPEGDAGPAGLVPTTVVTITSDADQALADMASALRLSLDVSTRRGPRGPRPAGGPHD